MLSWITVWACRRFGGPPAVVGRLAWTGDARRGARAQAPLVQKPQCEEGEFVAHAPVCGGREFVALAPLAHDSSLILNFEIHQWISSPSP